MTTEPVTLTGSRADYRHGYSDALLDVQKMLEERSEMATPGAPRWAFQNAARGVHEMLENLRG